MDDFTSNFFPNLKQYFIISEGKHRRKQRWILTKEYFQPFETFEDNRSFVLVEGSDQEFSLRLKCAYNAAKAGIKEGLLTGFFFGGFWSLLKELNDFDFGYFEKVNTPKEDEINRKIANRSYAVMKSFEYAQKYTTATEPISIISSLSKNTILTESLKSYHNISPLDLIMRNSVKTSSEGKYGGGETKSVKNLFQQSSELFSKTNHILESLYPKVPDFYDGNRFGFRKGREKVEIVGCALIQTTGSLGSMKSRSSSDDDELPKKKSEESEPPQPTPSKSEKSMTKIDDRELKKAKSKVFQSTDNIKSEPKKSVLLNRNITQRKSTNIKFDSSFSRTRETSKDKRRKSSIKPDTPPSKLMHSGSYKSTLLNNLPEDYDVNDIDQSADNGNKYEERSNYRRSSTYRQSRGSILLPPDFLEKYGRHSKENKVESYKKKLHYLVNIDELSNGYCSDDTPPPTVTSYRLRRPVTEPSDTSLFLEEIKKLREGLLDEPPYQSSGELTPENSYLGSKKYILSEKPSEIVKTHDSERRSVKASKMKITPSSHEFGLIKSFFHKRKPLALEKESKPEVPPRKRKPSTMSIFQSSEIDIVPAPRKKISSITSSAHSSRDLTQASKGTSSTAPTPSNKESGITPETRETQPSVAPVVLSQIPQAVPTPRKIQQQTAPEQGEIQPSAASTHKQTQPSSAPSLQSQISQATPTPRPRQPSVTPSPRQTQPSVAQKSETAPSSSQTQPSVTPVIISRIPQAIPTPRQTAPPPEEAQPSTASAARETQPSTAPMPRQSGQVSRETQPSVAPVPIQTQPSSAPSLQGHITQATPTPRQRQSSATASPRQTQPLVTPSPISQAPEAIPTPRKRQPSITPTSGEAQPYVIPSVLSETPQATPAPRKRRSSLVPTSQTHQPTVVPSSLNHPAELTPIPKQRQTSITENIQASTAPADPTPTQIPEVAPSPKQRKFSAGGSQVPEVASAPKQTAAEETKAPIPPAAQIPQEVPQIPKPTQPPVTPAPQSKEPKVGPEPGQVQPSDTPIVQNSNLTATPAPRQTAPSTAPTVETKSSVYPPPLRQIPDVPPPTQAKPSTAPSTGITQPPVSSNIPGQEPDSVSAPKQKKLSIAPIQESKVPPAIRQTRVSVSPTLPHQEMDGASAPRQPKPSTAQPTEVTPASRAAKASILISSYGQNSEAVPKPRTAKPPIVLGPSNQAPEIMPKKPSTAPALQTQGPKIVPALKTARPSGAANSEIELKKKPQKRVSLAPERSRLYSQFLSSLNENLMFINACNCALVVGIICCGLSALRASCLVINQ